MRRRALFVVGVAIPTLLAAAFAGMVMVAAVSAQTNELTIPPTKNGAELQVLPPVTLGPSGMLPKRRNNETSRSETAPAGSISAVGRDTQGAQGAPHVVMSRLADYSSSLAPRQRRAWINWLIADIEANKAPRLTAAEEASAVALVRSEAEPDWPASR